MTNPNTLRERVAKAIADAIGHGMAEKCERQADAAIAAMQSLATPQPAPVVDAEAVCFQAYQVVGVLLSDLGIFETPMAEKVLDNLSQCRIVHSDALPWPTAATPSIRPALQKCYDVLLAFASQPLDDPPPWVELTKAFEVAEAALAAQPASDAEATCLATAMEGWRSAIEDAGEIAANSTDQRIVSRASRVVTYLKANRPTKPASDRLAQLEDQAEKARALEERWRSKSAEIAKPYGFVTEHTLGKAQSLDQCADELAAIYKDPSHD